MKTIRVENERQQRAFLRMPRRIYQQSPYWVQSPDAELEGIFNPGSNPFFEHGALCRWILIDEKEEVAGRIAAFVDWKKTNLDGIPCGGIGFFECINDRSAADQLFETGRSWLEGRGMRGMLGPVNFGENNMYWGLLTSGYENLPYYGTQYHPPYYKDLFENYGFTIHFKQFSFRFTPEIFFDERIRKIATYSASRYGFTVEPYDQAQQERFIDAFVTIYNGAFNFLDNFSPMFPTVARNNFKKFKPIIEKDAAIFVFHGDAPVGFIISIPDINPIVQHMRGNSTLISKLKFLWYHSQGNMNRLRIAHFGVVKEHQQKGVSAILATAIYDFLMQQQKFREIEISWIGSFNPKMIDFMSNIGADQYKTHWTMIKKFE